jgi:magnesium-protoporphyrin O-methyltransferase
MITVGRLFPRGDRAPWIEPMARSGLQRLIAEAPALQGYACARCERVASGFYTSQALELVRQ